MEIFYTADKDESNGLDKTEFTVALTRILDVHVENVDEVFSHLIVFQLLFLLFSLTHYVACFWHFVGYPGSSSSSGGSSIADDPEPNWLIGEIRPDQTRSDEAILSWPSRCHYGVVTEYHGAWVSRQGNWKTMRRSVIDMVRTRPHSFTSIYSAAPHADLRTCLCVRHMWLSCHVVSCHGMG